MGVVYRARDEVLDREVAIKLIRPEAAGDEEVRHRFLREARLAAAINHPGVATLFEAGEAEIDTDDGIAFVLSLHRGEMPPFKSATFETVPALIRAMREIEPDLRRWKLQAAK